MTIIHPLVYVAVAVCWVEPVYEEDGSAAHVSWCPCYTCQAERAEAFVAAAELGNYPRDGEQ